MNHYASFEDFLYILAGLVWFGFSIYKGMKKQKKSTPAKSSSPKKPADTLDSWLEKFLEPEKPAQAEAIIYEAPQPAETTQAVETEPELFSYDDDFEKSDYDETLAEAPEKNDSKKPEESIKTSLRKNIKKQRFNLRQAVIYSAILNRPYG